MHNINHKEKKHAHSTIVCLSSKLKVYTLEFTCF